MKVKPIETYWDDIEENEKEMNVGIDEIAINYVQNGDCTETDDVQQITISARNNGLARFINIKTDSWSIESEEELINLIQDFKKRAELE